MNITVDASKAFFTADLHFWHKKCMELRGYPSPEAMHTDMIWRWNSRVRKGDTVFILGDVSFAGAGKTLEVLNLLNGNLVLVRGNHDKAMNDVVLSRFQSHHDLLTVKIMGKAQADGGRPLEARIVCCHFPMLSWDMQHYGAWHFHGHSHGSARYPSPRGRLIDVGVDAQPGVPMSFSELKAQIEQLPIVVTDYHSLKTTTAEGAAA